jgi:hypothetical protein
MKANRRKIQTSFYLNKNVLRCLKLAASQLNESQSSIIERMIRSYFPQLYAKVETQENEKAQNLKIADDAGSTIR